MIIATRPLLLSVLKERLDKLGRAEEDWQKFLALPKSLISISIKSADKILQILRDENSLIGASASPGQANQLTWFQETFLPFDLELTYAAAIHLTMANALFPSPTDGQSNSEIAHSILDEMILSGNRVAEARKAELSRIENLFGELTKRVEREGLRILRLSGREIMEPAPVANPDGDQPGAVSVTEPGIGQTPARDSSPLSAGPSVSANIDSLGIIGISSSEFLSIVDQINNPATSYGIMDAGPDWLPGDDITGPFN